MIVKAYFTFEGRCSWCHCYTWPV